MNPIEENRKKEGWSQAKLAEILGVHQTAVSQWETGKTLPDVLTAQKLALVFGVNIEDLLESAEYGQYPRRDISDTALKLSLFGCDVDTDMLNEVKKYAEFLLLQQKVKAAFTITGGDLDAEAQE